MDKLKHIAKYDKYMSYFFMVCSVNDSDGSTYI